jgi:hypothetical protein
MGFSTALNFSALLNSHTAGEQTFLAVGTVTTLTADIVWTAGMAVARNATYGFAGEALMQIGGSVATGVALPMLAWDVLKRGGEIAQQNDTARRSFGYQGATSWGRLLMEMGGTLSAAGY